MAVSPIPAGYHSVTPYLAIRGAARAMEFYKKAFGAVETMRLPAPDGKIGHAEIRIGNSVIMLADEAPEWGNKSPQMLGGSATTIMLYVENSDAMFAAVIKAGAIEKMPMKDQFYGDRSGTLEDPFGHLWTISTHTEDVAPEEINRRVKALFGG